MQGAGRDEAWAVNVLGTRNVLDAARALGVGIESICSGRLTCVDLQTIQLFDHRLGNLVEGVGDDVEIEFVTPLSGAFTKPVATKVLTDALDDKNIKLTPNFALGSVDHTKKAIQAYDGTEIEYDMLVSIPPNFGAEVMIESFRASPQPQSRSTGSCLTAERSTALAWPAFSIRVATI